MFYLLLVGRKKEREKKKKERNSWGAFFPRAGHAFLAVLCRIFATVRCD
jgi:hypothetical protein